MFRKILEKQLFKTKIWYSSLEKLSKLKYCGIYVMPTKQEQAQQLDLLPPEKRGPLHGIPVSIKESISLKVLNMCVCVCDYHDILASKYDFISLLRILSMIIPLQGCLVSFHQENPIAYQLYLFLFYFACILPFFQGL